MEVFRKLLVGLVGFPLLVLGIVLVPLPGPGLLICFIALFILSYGFEWAHAYFEKTKNGLKIIYKKAKQQSEKIEEAINKKRD